MRCFLRRSLIAAIFLLVFVFISLTIWTQKDLEMEEAQRWAQGIGLQQLQADWNLHSLQNLTNATNVLSISYHYLAGIPPLQKSTTGLLLFSTATDRQTCYPTCCAEFLTVGLCSIKRKKGNYLLETLRSIFDQSTREELNEMVVVVHLADPDQEWNAQVVANIAKRFAHQILLGCLLVIHAPHEYYPSLEGLKQNFNDAKDRVKFRSKQNVDYAYLMNFAANLSTHYLMIEDDVHCAKNFFSAIRRVLESQKGSYWVTLEFSKLGYIGKLYHSSDLPQLSRFLLLFYQEMPCDWLLGHFRLLLTQREVIRFKPSLFQHIGLYSSFQGSANKLKDEDFEEDPAALPDNPPADMVTDIASFQNYSPNKAYSNTEEYFWGKAPSAGNTFTIVFKQPARIFRIQIQTGSEKHHEDYLQAGLVELGTQKKSDGKGCNMYTSIGLFEKGNFNRQGLENTTASAPECIHIVVTQDQSEWLIIRSINIWTKPSP